MGIADSVGPDGVYPTSRLTSDLSYRLMNAAKDLELNVALEREVLKQKTAEPNPPLLPPGAFGGLFP